VLDALRASRGAPGPYALQAAIAGCHARATKAEETDWPQIEGLYAVLYRIHPSPVVALNGAVATAMVRGPERGLALIARIAKGELDGYYLLHAATADLLRRLDRFAEAEAAYERALELAQSEPERRFLKRRLGEIATSWKKA
jgi:RNA polymerase sigma-70 factor (ECF subfamily)